MINDTTFEIISNFFFNATIFNLRLKFNADFIFTIESVQWGIIALNM